MGRIWGVAIGSWPGPIPGANISGVLAFRGRLPAPTVALFRPVIFRGFPELPNSAKFPGFRDVGRGAPERVASSGISGAGGSELEGGDWQLAGAKSGG